MIIYLSNGIACHAHSDSRGLAHRSKNFRRCAVRTRAQLGGLNQRGVSERLTASEKSLVKEATRRAHSRRYEAGERKARDSEVLDQRAHREIRRAPFCFARICPHLDAGDSKTQRDYAGGYLSPFREQGGIADCGRSLRSRDFADQRANARAGAD